MVPAGQGDGIEVQQGRDAHRLVAPACLPALRARAVPVEVASARRIPEVADLAPRAGRVGRDHLDVDPHQGPDVADQRAIAARRSSTRPVLGHDSSPSPRLTRGSRPRAALGIDLVRAEADLAPPSGTSVGAWLDGVEVVITEPRRSPPPRLGPPDVSS